MSAASPEPENDYDSPYAAAQVSALHSVVNNSNTKDDLSTTDSPASASSNVGHQPDIVQSQGSSLWPSTSEGLETIRDQTTTISNSASEKPPSPTSSIRANNSTPMEDSSVVLNHTQISFSAPTTVTGNSLLTAVNAKRQAPEVPRKGSLSSVNEIKFKLEELETSRSESFEAVNPEAIEAQQTIARTTSIEESAAGGHKPDTMPDSKSSDASSDSKTSPITSIKSYSTLDSKSSSNK